ncbi:MAG: hypothetical protein GY896_23040 [Gammaproteobacteria bacterium]|nr:hypothetical protein [Gammaproteobacteria bacterium]
MSEQDIVISESSQTVIVTQQETEIISEGAQGPRGVSAEDVVPLARRTDIIDDSPAAGFQTIYVADASVGTLDADSQWRIKRIIIDNNSDGDAVIEWAELTGTATSDFVFSWNDHLTLSYS